MTLFGTASPSFSIWATLGGHPALAEAVWFNGQGSLHSGCAVSSLAAGSVDAVKVDRRFASFWFAWSFREGGLDAAARPQPDVGSLPGYVARVLPPSS